MRATIHRRGFLAVPSLLFMAGGAAAQAWPSRPIRMIVGYAPGGTADVAIRALAPGAGERLGQPIVIENRAGANGAIGMEALARAAPDGHTFAMAADSAVFQTLLRPGYAYDAQRDLDTVGLLVSQPIVIAVHPSLGVRSLPELLALVRRRGAEMPYAVAGLGGTQHLAAAAMAERLGVTLTPVAYRGGGQAINDLVGGQVPLGIMGSTPVLPHVREGRLRVLAVTSPRRTPALPDVPTVAEAAGLPDYGFEQWFGVLAPKRTPSEIILRMNAALNDAMAQEPIRRLLADLALEAMGGTPEAFARRIEREGRVWTELGARLGLGAG